MTVTASNDNDKRLRLISAPNLEESYYAIWYEDYLDGMGYDPDSDIAGNVTINFPIWLKESHINDLITLAAKTQSIPTMRQIQFLTALKSEFLECQSF